MSASTSSNTGRSSFLIRKTRERRININLPVFSSERRSIEPRNLVRLYFYHDLPPSIKLHVSTTSVVEKAPHLPVRVSRQPLQLYKQSSVWLEYSALILRCCHDLSLQHLRKITIFVQMKRRVKQGLEDLTLPEAPAYTYLWQRPQSASTPSKSSGKRRS